MYLSNKEGLEYYKFTYILIEGLKTHLKILYSILQLLSPWIFRVSEEIGANSVVIIHIWESSYVRENPSN